MNAVIHVVCIIALVVSSSRDLWKQWVYGRIKFHWCCSWSSKA